MNIICPLQKGSKSSAFFANQTAFEKWPKLPPSESMPLPPPASASLPVFIIRGMASRRSSLYSISTEEISLPSVQPSVKRISSSASL